MPKAPQKPLTKPTRAAKPKAKVAAPKRSRGQPTTYTQAIAEELCRRLGLGEGLQPICREPAMPSQAVVYVWLRRHPEFLEMYTRAREEQAETHADEIVSIADETPQTREIKDKDGNVLAIALDSAYIQWQKQRIDSRKWNAAKQRPRKYGDKVTLGGDADNPIRIEAEVEAQTLLDALLKHAELVKQAAAEDEP
jgi:hypothetical protein